MTLKLTISFSDGFDAVYDVNPDGLFSWRNEATSKIVGIVICKEDQEATS